MKTLGLVALVIAATVLIGASSASAFVLKSVVCKADQELCKSENLWGSDVTIAAHSSKLVLLTSPVTLTCESSLTILTGKEDEHLILGTYTLLDFTNCSGCTQVTATTMPSVSLLTTADPLVATLDFTGKEVILMKGCPFGIECTATHEGGKMNVTGGTIGGTAQISANELGVGLSGGLCGSSGKMHGVYVVTSVNGNASGSIFFSLKTHGI